MGLPKASGFGTNSFVRRNARLTCPRIPSNAITHPCRRPFVSDDMASSCLLKSVSMLLEHIKKSGMHLAGTCLISREPFLGGAGRDRTDDLRLAKPPLSQLSYDPLFLTFPSLAAGGLVGLVGFEPTTPALSRRCSNQLSYRPARGLLPLPDGQRTARLFCLDNR